MTTADEGEMMSADTSTQGHTDHEALGPRPHSLSVGDAVTVCSDAEGAPFSDLSSVLPGGGRLQSWLPRCLSRSHMSQASSVQFLGWS